MEPLLLRPGEGEVISDRAEREVRILGGLDQLALTYSRYAEGERGPDPHIHRQHTDAWWVIAGELTFEVGGEAPFTAGPGSVVAVPAGVVHTFRNEAPADARFLNLHAPGMGFDDYLRALRDGDEEAVARFDSFDPPADGGRPASEALVSGPDEGETIMLGPSRALVKAGADHAGGHLLLGETRVAPGYRGPPPHRHNRTVEAFYLLDGTLRFLLGDEWREAGSGSFVLVAPGTVHTSQNVSGEWATAVSMMAPAGLERYMREIAAAAVDGAPDPALVAQIGAGYDVEPVA